MAVENYYNNWIDVAGKFMQTTYLWDAGGLLPNPTGLNPYLSLLSNANYVGYVHGRYMTDQNREGAGAIYPSVQDVCVLVFADDAGSVAKIYIPAPVSNMFLSDGVTVNTFDPQTAAFIFGVAIGSRNLFTSAGGLVTTYVSGFRQGKSVT